MPLRSLVPILFAIAALSAPAATITSPQYVEALLGDDVDYRITADNSPTVFSADLAFVSILSTTTFKSTGLTLDPAAGTLKGTVTRASRLFFIDLAAKGATDTARGELLLRYSRRPTGSFSMPLAITVASGEAFTLPIETAGVTTSAFSFNANDDTRFNSVTVDDSGVLKGTGASTGGLYVFFAFAQNSTEIATSAIQITVPGGFGPPKDPELLRVAGTVGRRFFAPVRMRGKAPATMTVTGLPAGLAVEGTAITGTPLEGGAFPVEVTITNDEGSATFKSTLGIVGADGLPVVYTPPPTTVEVGDPINLLLRAQSDLGQTVTVDVTKLPRGVTFRGSTQAFMGMPFDPGVYEIPITVTNSAGTVFHTFVLNVTSPPKSNVSGTLKLSDTYKDSLKTFVEEGEKDFDVVSTAKYSVSAKIVAPGFDPASITADTPFTFAVGDASFSTTAGAFAVETPAGSSLDGTFTPGKGFSFDEFILGDSDIGAQKRVGGVKVKFGKGSITVTAQRSSNSFDDDTISLFADHFLERSAVISEIVPVKIKLGTITFFALATLEGKATAKEVASSGDGLIDEILTSVSLKAKATVLAGQ